MNPIKADRRVRNWTRRATKRDLSILVGNTFWETLSIPYVCQGSSTAVRELLFWFPGPLRYL